MEAKTASRIDLIGYGLVLLFALASNVSPAAASVAIYGSLPLIIFHFRKVSFADEQKKAAIVMLLFFGFFSATALASFNPQRSLEIALSDVMRFVPFFMAVAFVRERRQIVTIACVMAFSMLSADGYAIWQKVHGIERPTGFDHQVLFFANQLLLMIVLSGTALFSDRLSGRVRLYFGVTAAVSTVVLLLNLSRGVWLALGVVLLVYAFIERRNKRLVMAVLLLVILCLLSLWLVPSFNARIQTLVDPSFGSNSERLLMLQSAWQMFLDHPVAGVGIGQFQHFYGTQYISPLAKEGAHASPHNNFAMYLAETGLIGFLAFCGLFLSMMFIAYRRYRQTGDSWALGGALAILGFLLTGLTDHTFGMMNVLRMLWFIVGLGLVRTSEERWSRRSIGKMNYWQ